MEQNGTYRWTPSSPKDVDPKKLSKYILPALIALVLVVGLLLMRTPAKKYLLPHT